MSPRPHPEGAPPDPSERLAARLDRLAELAPAASPEPGATGALGAAACLLGECLDARHPALTGRVLVRWSAARGERQLWVPTLQNLPVRAGDRVLLVQPENHDEPVVVGVLDGFARRPTPERESAARIELQRDEAVRIAGADGRELLELIQTEAGPVVRLLHGDVNLELPGALRLKAAQIELKADAGSVEIEASDEVNVRGEVVNLN